MTKLNTNPNPNPYTNHLLIPDPDYDVRPEHMADFQQWRASTLGETLPVESDDELVTWMERCMTNRQMKYGWFLQETGRDPGELWPELVF